jgi:hypothetical protein
VRHYRWALEEYRTEIAPFARAGAQFNLGNALRLLGQRNNDGALILGALENHAAACRECLPYSPYWAFRAAGQAVGDAEALKAHFDPSVYQAALAKHDRVLALPVKHQGHRVGLMPVFRAVVAGTSGLKKPDFSAAPRRGDRIKDGTVVWENAGKYSYCEQCEEFLTAPNGGT